MKLHGNIYMRGMSPAWKQTWCRRTKDVRPGVQEDETDGPMTDEEVKGQRQLIKHPASG